MFANDSQQRAHVLAAVGTDERHDGLGCEPHSVGDGDAYAAISYIEAHNTRRFRGGGCGCFHLSILLIPKAEADRIAAGVIVCSEWASLTCEQHKIERYPLRISNLRIKSTGISD